MSNNSPAIATGSSLQQNSSSSSSGNGTVTTPTTIHATRKRTLSGMEGGFPIDTTPSGGGGGVAAAAAAAAGMSSSSSLSSPPTMVSHKIDPSRERYPFCVVWTPIPLLSWMFPMVGHMGICDSQGIIHDFAGNYFISEDAMLFGDPVKYWDLSPYIFPRIKELQVLYGCDAQTATRQYDEALKGATEYFRASQQYNFFTNNCHSYVGAVMEAANINRSRWGMVKVVLYMMLFGKYVSAGRFLKAHLPFLILCGLCFAFGFGVSSASTSPRGGAQ